MFPLTRGSYGLIGCPWCYDFLGTKLRFGSYTVDGIPQNTPKIASTKKSEKKKQKTTTTTLDPAPFQADIFALGVVLFQPLGPQYSW